MTKSAAIADCARYLVKIVGGLLALATIIGTGLFLKAADLSATGYKLALAAVVLALLAIVPLVRIVVRNMDELQQALHEKASACALVLAAAIAAAVGVLQANGVIPLFNQLWSFAFALAVWAVSLMLSDAKFK